MRPWHWFLLGILVLAGGTAGISALPITPQPTPAVTALYWFSQIGYLFMFIGVAQWWSRRKKQADTR